MRFLILNVNYDWFLQWLYAMHPGLGNRSYEEQVRTVSEAFFIWSYSYSSNLRNLGYEAWEIQVNNEWMQKAWAREYGKEIKEPKLVQQRSQDVLRQALQLAGRSPLRYLKPILRPIIPALDSHQMWFYDILTSQIKHYKPDVLINQAMVAVSSDFLRQMKSNVRLLVGQIASPFPEGIDFSCYDLVISSLPNIVEYFNKLGIPSELHRLGFEPKVLEKLKDTSMEEIPVSFVGNMFVGNMFHGSRIRLLEYLCKHLDIGVWGIGIDKLPKDSPIRQCYRGTAWAIEMYQILHNSKITLNHHIDIAGSYANNLRLYEATGVGTMLITDWKENLHEIFEPGKEVVAYRTPDECAELIRYYLNHEGERKAIARAGQERTLREHTYYQRMQELADIVCKYI